MFNTNLEYLSVANCFILKDYFKFIIEIKSYVPLLLFVGLYINLNSINTESMGLVDCKFLIYAIKITLVWW